MLKEILKNDVHLDLLKIAKMTSDLELKKIMREKEKSQVSKGSVYLNRLVNNAMKFISFRLRPVRPGPTVQFSNGGVIIKVEEKPELRGVSTIDSGVNLISILTLATIPTLRKLYTIINSMKHLQ